MRVSLARDKYEHWLVASPWLVFGAGVLLALAVVTLAMIIVLQPPIDELATLVGVLALTSIGSLTAGYVLYRRGWARSPSLRLTLILTYAWAAFLTLFNVWVLARLMFVEPHDLSLAGVLLLFAGFIATVFGIFVATSVTDSLRQLAIAADKLASGDLSARADVSGRDEISQVAVAFNEMAVQLQQAEDERKELETLRKDLIAWTSHDLRTPLTSIRVMVEALNDGVVTEDETRRRYYQTMQAEIVALNDLIDDLFELAQLDAGGLVLQIEPHSLGDLISDTLESFRPVAKTRDVKLNGKIGPRLDPVLMDAARISRVLVNIVDNAIQHTPSGGQVQLTATRRKEGVQVVISDDGPGFSTEDIPRIFEKFYRGERARSRATGGSGLGLAIAAGIIEAHGGRIWAANREKGGATVTFVLFNELR